MCKTVPEQVRHRLDPSCFLSSSNSFLLPLGINLEISGRFYSKRQGGSYEVCRPTGSVDLGLNKSWLDGCRRIALLMTDVFHAERWDSYGTKDKLILSSWACGEPQDSAAIDIWFRKAKIREN